MFAQCDRETMTIIDAAFDEARRLGHNHLGTGHLLLALAQRPDLFPDPVASLLPSAETVGSAILDAIGGPAADPAELLERVGIDLDAVRVAVRRTFGDEAIQRLSCPVHQPWQPWRRPSRRCTSVLAGTMTVAPRVKQALEHATRRQAGTISPAGMLLGMIEVEDALSNRLLRDAGIEPDQIRRLLTGTDG